MLSTTPAPGVFRTWSSAGLHNVCWHTRCAASESAFVLPICTTDLQYHDTVPWGEVRGEAGRGGRRAGHAHPYSVQVPYRTMITICHRNVAQTNLCAAKKSATISNCNNTDGIK